MVGYMLMYHIFKSLGVFSIEVRGRDIVAEGISAALSCTRRDIIHKRRPMLQFDIRLISVYPTPFRQQWRCARAVAGRTRGHRHTKIDSIRPHLRDECLAHVQGFDGSAIRPCRALSPAHLWAEGHHPRIGAVAPQFGMLAAVSPELGRGGRVVVGARGA